MKLNDILTDPSKEANARDQLLDIKVEMREPTKKAGKFSAIKDREWSSGMLFVVVWKYEVL